MRGKQFGWLLSGASCLGAFVGLLLMGAFMEGAVATPGGRVVWVGGFFLLLFVLGFCGLQLAMQLNRAYRVQRNRLWLAAFLLACLVVFGVGAGGQYLFMFSKEEIVTPAEVDMVLLLDASGSMDSSGFNTPRTEAACQFVDSLSTDCRLQAVSFAGKVLDSTQLLVANDANKNILKQMISAIDASGATDFNEPLVAAMNTLNTQGRPNCNKAVILLTDGQSDLDPGVVSSYLSSDIRVFTIRISVYATLDSDEKALVDLANRSGGFDTHLMPRSDGSIDTAAMLQAFRDAFEATSRTEVTMSQALIVCAPEGVTFWQLLLRILVMAVCAVATGIGYFGTFSPGSLISSGVMGAAAAVLVTMVEGAGYFPCALVILLLTETAFVFLDLRGEDRIHV